MFGCMETPEAWRPRVRREQPLIARLRLATTRLADADRARIWAMSRQEAGLSIRKYVRLAAHRCPSLAAKQVTPHVLRHTCAMMILQATGDLRKVVARDEMADKGCCAREKEVMPDVSCSFA